MRIPFYSLFASLVLASTALAQTTILPSSCILCISAGYSFSKADERCVKSGGDLKAVKDCILNDFSPPDDQVFSRLITDLSSETDSKSYTLPLDKDNAKRELSYLVANMQLKKYLRVQISCTGASPVTYALKMEGVSEIVDPNKIAQQMVPYTCGSSIDLKPTEAILSMVVQISGTTTLTYKTT